MPERPARWASTEALGGIATRIMQQAPLWTDWDGVLIAPDDTEAIAAALRLDIQNHELRAQYGAVAYARVADQLDILNIRRRLDALYCEVPA
jgi:glycosyltransferase involved in cell wall biosynthesis